MSRRSCLIPNYLGRIACSTRFIDFILVALLTVVVLRYAQPIPDEDAYISFVFSKSLLLGEGLSYLGARIEGFTNPLTVLLTVFFTFLTGFEVAQVGFVLSILFTVLTINLLLELIPFSIASATGLSLRIFIFAIVFINPIILTWGFSGMENSLFSAVWLLALISASKQRVLATCILLSILPIIRSDALPITILTAIIVSSRLQLRSLNQKQLLSYCAILVLPALSYLVFRLTYFGELLPNTATKKFLERDSFHRIYEGVVYVLNYSLYSKSPIILVLMLAYLGISRIKLSHFVNTAVLFFSSLLFVAYLGGDVSWKGAYRFCFASEILAIAAMILFLSDSRANIRVISILGILLLKLVVWPVGQLSDGINYSTRLYSNLVIREPWSQLDFNFKSPRDFLDLLVPRDDVLTVTGRYLNQCKAPKSTTLITSAAGKVAYQAEMPTIDMTQLAATPASIQHYLNNRSAAELFVFEHHFGRKWYFDQWKLLDEVELQAVFYSGRFYSGMPVLVFAKDELSCPKLVLADYNFIGVPVEVSNRRFLLFTDNMFSQAEFLTSVEQFDYFSTSDPIEGESLLSLGDYSVK